jgi:hypothetical protein
MLRHEASALPASSKQLVCVDASLRNRHDRTGQFALTPNISCMLALLQNTLIVICKIWVTISYRKAGSPLAFSTRPQLVLS